MGHGDIPIFAVGSEMDLSERTLNEDPLSNVQNWFLFRQDQAMERKSSVAYYFDNDIGDICFGPSHPMKPIRVRMTHSLCLTYGVLDKITVFKPQPLDASDMKHFHTGAYIDFLREIEHLQKEQNRERCVKFNLSEENTIFDDIFKYCQIYTGGSLDGAHRLNEGLCDIAINWAGGMHNARKGEASGFCYVNDAVLAIQELLKYNPRVMYIDIDAHHCDAVEEAFYFTDRVMTVSFHKYGEYFPGSGTVKEYGCGQGKYYSINFPLKDGIGDQKFNWVFYPIITKTVDVFRPTVIVIQCGADSLGGDPLGPFDLSIDGHSECLKIVKLFKIPLLLLGGGGYNIANTARVWTNETAIAANIELPNDIPLNDFYHKYAPSYKLKEMVRRGSGIENKNTDAYLQQTSSKVIEMLTQLEFAPNVTTDAGYGSNFPTTEQEMKSLLDRRCINIPDKMKDQLQNKSKEDLINKKKKIISIEKAAQAYLNLSSSNWKKEENDRKEEKKNKQQQLQQQYQQRLDQRNKEEDDDEDEYDNQYDNADYDDDGIDINNIRSYKKQNQIINKDSIQIIGNVVNQLFPSFSTRPDKQEQVKGKDEETQKQDKDIEIEKDSKNQQTNIQENQSKENSRKSFIWESQYNTADVFTKMLESKLKLKVSP
ncbi:MAG: putative Histone deacetylase 1 [Streblomastix strix]|uniref:histone deacetylase n=1 Tax=Streblomastix strix TaxID=222440 RepID=A0A5J4VUF2_9EUKA|nr:MAG: putative Histone deacetylase 1 [Streblomastix strix]